MEPVSLSNKIALIGHDGWYDGRDPLTWWVFCYDWFLIKDFWKLKGNSARFNKVQEQTELAAKFLEKALLKALETHTTIYLLTHFPPWPEDRPSWKNLVNRFWRPYNSSKVISETLERIMSQFPQKNLIVLAGHTHIQREEQITNNITLKVGKAKNGSPVIQEIFEIKKDVIGFIK